MVKLLVEIWTNKAAFAERSDLVNLDLVTSLLLEIPRNVLAGDFTLYGSLKESTYPHHLIILNLVPSIRTLPYTCFRDGREGVIPIDLLRNLRKLCIHDSRMFFVDSHDQDEFMRNKLSRPQICFYHWM